MPGIQGKINGEAAKKSDAELQRRHPELKGRSLTTSAQDAKLRDEWVRLYEVFGGRLVRRSQPAREKTSLAACASDPSLRQVYVYLNSTAADGWGHVGLIMEQKDGSFIRYSQAVA